VRAARGGRGCGGARASAPEGAHMRVARASVARAARWRRAAGRGGACARGVKATAVGPRARRAPRPFDAPRPAAERRAVVYAARAGRRRSAPAGVTRAHTPGLRRGAGGHRAETPRARPRRRARARASPRKSPPPSSRAKHAPRRTQRRRNGGRGTPLFIFPEFISIKPIIGIVSP